MKVWKKDMYIFGEGSIEMNTKKGVKMLPEGSPLGSPKPIYWLKKELQCKKPIDCPQCHRWMFCIELKVSNDAERVVNAGLTSGCVLPNGKT